MATRLDVGNLTDDAHPDTLRACFAEHGEVVDVRMVNGGHAFVTMARQTDARAAVAKLDGMVFDDRTLRVVEAREQPGGGSTGDKGVRITRQHRERTHMTYELDHAGTPLCIRLFPTHDGSGEAKWRVELTSSRAGDSVISAAAPTRAAALEEIGQLWRDQASALNLPSLDWKAILHFMTAVRAI